jgi:hypothetical protein
MKCLEREPQNRYRDVAELAIDLANLADSHHEDPQAMVPTGAFFPGGRQIMGTPPFPQPAPTGTPPPARSYPAGKYMLPAPAPMAAPPTPPPSQFARGSQPTIPPEAEPVHPPVVPPGGVWRTMPAPYVPPAHTMRASQYNLPQFDVTQATARDAWIGRAVWIMAIAIIVLAALVVRHAL